MSGTIVKRTTHETVDVTMYRYDVLPDGYAIGDEVSPWEDTLLELNPDVK